MKSKSFLATPGTKIKLTKWSTSATGKFKGKDAAQDKLEGDIAKLKELQDVFYAADTYSLLIIFQAMDAAGKDGAIKHVMSGVNPQGCQVASFKSPSAVDLDHDYLWRSNTHLPERGRIGIFNRSYYEEVLVVRVHPEFLDAQKLPPSTRKGDIWKRRFREINAYEKYLTDNGTRVVKFFLHLSKAEQKTRFMDRIERPDKNWKLSPSDVKERQLWDEYQHAYEDMITHTSTEHAPWYIVPADHKWFSRAAIAEILVSTLKSLKLEYPTLDTEGQVRLAESKALLDAEDQVGPNQ